jgi:hypothetical protein
MLSVYRRRCRSPVRMVLELVRLARFRLRNLSCIGPPWANGLTSIRMSRQRIDKEKVQSGFRPTTTKPGIGHPKTIKTVQFTHLDGSVGGFHQCGATSSCPHVQIFTHNPFNLYSPRRKGLLFFYLRRR